MFKNFLSKFKFFDNGQINIFVNCLVILTAFNIISYLYIESFYFYISTVFQVAAFLYLIYNVSNKQEKAHSILINADYKKQYELIFICNLEGACLYISPSFELLGYSLKDLQSISINRLFDIDDLEIFTMYLIQRIVKARIDTADVSTHRYTIKDKYNNCVVVEGISEISGIGDKHSLDDGYKHAIVINYLKRI